MSDDSRRQEHWQKTKRLMITTLSIWFVFAFIVHWFSDSLNNITFLGFPMGYYMAAQGSLAIFVLTLFWFVHQQHKIDLQCGFAEEQEK